MVSEFHFILLYSVTVPQAIPYPAQFALRDYFILYIMKTKAAGLAGWTFIVDLPNNDT